MAEEQTSRRAADRRAQLRGVGVMVLAVGGIGLSLLLWGRLRLITNVPKTAYAEPEAREVEAQRVEPASEGSPPADEPAQRGN